MNCCERPALITEDSLRRLGTPLRFDGLNVSHTRPTLSGCLKVFCNSAESEAESTALAVPEVYSAYYSEMGGVGAAPEPKIRTPMTEGKVARPQRRSNQPGLSAASDPTRPMVRKPLPTLLIFGSMVALIVAYRFLAQ